MKFDGKKARSKPNPEASPRHAKVKEHPMNPNDPIFIPLIRMVLKEGVSLVRRWLKKRQQKPKPKKTRKRVKSPTAPRSKQKVRKKAL
jgi:hypothetical protein